MFTLPSSRGADAGEGEPPRPILMWRAFWCPQSVCCRSAAHLWVQASLEQRQWFQQLFFPDGISFDGSGFVGTAVTTRAFSYLRGIETGNEKMVDQTGIEPVTS